MLGRKTVAQVQNPKAFAARLQSCLNETEAPAPIRDRAVILSKLLDIPKHEAYALLEGREIPSPELLEQIANEFEVDPKWLSGN
jgi:hypothetical protein